jgi:hypothetical protein
MSCLATPLRFLPVLPQELQLATVLKSGQSFRWHRTSPSHATRSTSKDHRVEDGEEEWSFGWGDRTVVLRQDGKNVFSFVLHRLSTQTLDLYRPRGALPIAVSFQAETHCVLGRREGRYDSSSPRRLLPTLDSSRPSLPTMEYRRFKVRQEDEVRPRGRAIARDTGVETG